MLVFFTVLSLRFTFYLCTEDYLSVYYLELNVRPFEQDLDVSEECQVLTVRCKLCLNRHKDASTITSQLLLEKQ